jgi:hypothetical protein
MGQLLIVQMVKVVLSGWLRKYAILPSSRRISPHGGAAARINTIQYALAIQAIR